MSTDSASCTQTKTSQTSITHKEKLKAREKLGSMSFIFLTLILHSTKDVVGSNSALEKKGDPLCWGESVAMSCKSIPKVEDSTSTSTHNTLLILHYFLKTLFL